MGKGLINAKQLGSTIREKRQSLGYTQKSFADEIMVTEVYMNNIETGKHIPSNKLLKQIADKLGLTITIEIA